MNTHINLDKIKGTPIFKALSRLSVLLILFIILAFTTHNFIKASNLSTIFKNVRQWQNWWFSNSSNCFFGIGSSSFDSSYKNSFG